jgi:hypothetical protein
MDLSCSFALDDEYGTDNLTCCGDVEYHRLPIVEGDKDQGSGQNFPEIFESFLSFYGPLELLRFLHQVVEGQCLFP